jgi:hypothetical protein
MQEEAKMRSSVHRRPRRYVKHSACMLLCHLRKIRRVRNVQGLLKAATIIALSLPPQRPRSTSYPILATETQQRVEQEPGTTNWKEEGVTNAVRLLLRIPHI